MLHEESEYLPFSNPVDNDGDGADLTNGDVGLMCLCSFVYTVRIAINIRPLTTGDDPATDLLEVCRESFLSVAAATLSSVCLLLAANAAMRGSDRLGRRFARSIMKSFGDGPAVGNTTAAAVGESSGVMCFGLWFVIVSFLVFGGGGGSFRRRRQWGCRRWRMFSCRGGYSALLCTAWDGLARSDAASMEFLTRVILCVFERQKTPGSWLISVGWSYMEGGIVDIYHTNSVFS